MFTKVKVRKLSARRGLALVAAISALAGAGLVAFSSPASADTSCHHGDVCVFNENGNVVVSPAGNWYGSYWMGHGWIDNYGIHGAGYDDVRATVAFHDGSNPWTICLDDYDDPGDQFWAEPDNSNWYIRALEWGPECGAAEKYWHRP